MRLNLPAAQSYYTSSVASSATLEHPLHREPLRGELSADVVVLGGGIAGCSTALHLARRGYRVALLEAHSVGYGASGRSGGQVIFGLAAGQQALAAQVGRDDARRLFDLSIEALEVTRGLIREHAIDCDYRPNHVHVATKPRHLIELRDWERELKDEYGYGSARLLGRDELAAHVKSDRYLGGLIDPNSGHLHPLKFTLGLARAAEAAGAKIFERSCVLRYEGGPKVAVHTAVGTVRADHLVLCGNAYIGAVAPALARRILGVGTYIIATRPLGAAQAGELLPSNAAIADINWILDYFRRSADDRLLFGGRVSYSAFQPPRLAESMRRRMLRIFPSLHDVEVEYAWGGFLDITMSRAPNFGRLAPNVYYLQGFSGHGMSLTGLAGKLVAEAVAGTAERFDVFARIPHRDFPGGPLFRRPSLVLAMLYYRLKDLL
ncbi:MAG TPA: FAD-binding oxidoreductase [Steroidobacteraceae bacterium]|jgi:gamma-glutamylputrescine oxidase|nr:FAD-binding oxidoreductase [Steroidobacteraceae bacterium]